MHKVPLPKIMKHSNRTLMRDFLIYFKFALPINFIDFCLDIIVWLRIAKIRWVIFILFIASQLHSETTNHPSIWNIFELASSLFRTWLQIISILCRSRAICTTIYQFSNMVNYNDAETLRGYHWKYNLQLQILWISSHGSNHNLKYAKCKAQASFSSETKLQSFRSSLTAGHLSRVLFLLPMNLHCNNSTFLLLIFLDSFFFRFTVWAFSFQWPDGRLNWESCIFNPLVVTNIWNSIDLGWLFLRFVIQYNWMHIIHLFRCRRHRHRHPSILFNVKIVQNHFRSVIKASIR